jgi:hypothetical protein
MSHTPGPWKVKTTETGSQFIDAKGKYDYGHQAVLVVAPDDCATHPIADSSANWTCRDGAECEANARLIAAAPELLANLERIVNLLPYIPIAVADYDHIDVDAARAAINKAKGLT